MRFGGLGGWEWIIVLVIVIIVFGVGKLPQVGAALGQSIREFREATSKPKEDEPTSDEVTSDEVTSESKV
jgi:sec-independent protein translocase protein TatA